jgi:hypothetical protein
VAHFVWETRPTHGPPHTKWVPHGSLSDPGTFARTIAARSGSVVLCGSRARRRDGDGRRPSTLGGPGDRHRPASLAILPCQVGCLTVTDGARVRPPDPTPGMGAAAHPSSSLPPAAGRELLALQPWGVRVLLSCPARPVLCGQPDHRDVSGAQCRGVRGWLKEASGGTRRGDRSPRAIWPPATMESVDRWPLAIPDTQIPGGSRPAGAAVRRRVRGVWTPHPRVVCRSSVSAREGDLPGSPACGPALRGFSGGNWMAARVPPVRRAGALWPGARSPLPDLYIRVFSSPFAGGGLGRRRPCTSACRGRWRPVAPCYLVDSASSHMLVSKIKPCMSKYKHFIL